MEKADLIRKLSAQGYWPARAASYLTEGMYSRSVEICKDHLREEPQSLSGRLIYALALQQAGQTKSATEQFYNVLSLDPDNLVALKCLGDIKYAESDEMAALSDYARILEIDPYCTGLKSDLKTTKRETAKTITFKREAEAPTSKRALPSQQREIPFYTETIGDLYLAQGHPRLAAEVYHALNEKNHNSKLVEKLKKAEHRIKEKEHRHVS